MADNIFKASKPRCTTRIAIRAQWKWERHPTKLSDECERCLKSDQAHYISRCLWQVGCVDEEGLTTRVHGNVSCRAKGKR